MTTLYRQLKPDPGRKDLRTIEVFDVTGACGRTCKCGGIVRFREYPAEGDDLLKFRTCDEWTLKYFWELIPTPLIPTP